MPDFNKVLDPGDYQQGLVNTVIEIPMGSAHKIEWDRSRAAFMLDRVEPKIFAKPVNYGFIPGTLDEDGDELDTLVVTEEPLPTGIWLETKIIGIMNFEDDAEMDYKIVCVPSDDRNTGDSLNTLADLGDRWREQVEYHFSHYKDLKKPGTTIVKSWGDTEEAKKIIRECIERYSK
ncbi:MAG TPA: inorganic pyrophosphatase [Desulfocapsa sulfexigens]|nr:inorganic pyrophosphatase [Desulfocapsa sulfexigens]HIQ36624.1 inorganic pyrophosphatase [Desulfocapsa sulfexigens]